MYVLQLIPYASPYDRSGSPAQEELDEDGEKERRLVEAMKILGDAAAAKQITLVLEDHFNTMTVTARRAAEIVSRINHPNVGILYDQVNLVFVGGEDPEDAISAHIPGNTTPRTPTSSDFQQLPSNP